MSELEALLPAALRAQDELLGRPLGDLLRLFEGPLAHLDEDLAQLYDDLFIETCAEWVVPYLGDLVAHRPLRGSVPRLASPRADVARTIAYRRRKGTAPILEQIARDVSGCPARAIESWQTLSITQHFLHLRPHRPYAPDLRRTGALRHHADAFGSAAHTIDVRASQPYSVPHVRVFLWRLRALPLGRVTPLALDATRFFFAPEGGRVPLFNRPDPAYDGPVLTPAHVPQAITRRDLFDDLTTYYGERASVAVHLGDLLVPAAQIDAADLSDRTPGDPASAWQHDPRPGRVLIDPELGRLAVAPDLLAAGPVRVSFHVGAAAELGGGQYERPGLATPDVVFAEGDPLDVLRKHLQKISQGEGPGGAPLGGALVVELGGSPTHDLGDLTIAVPKDTRLVLRAGQRQRPHLRVGTLTLKGAAGSALELDGLVIAGRIVVDADADFPALGALAVRHCTLVPGLTRTSAGRPGDPAAPSLEVRAPTLRLTLERCITGPLRPHAGVTTALTLSVLDASRPDAPAFEAAGGGPGGALSLDRCTVIGTVHAESLDLVTNSLLLARLPAGSGLAGPVVSERRQIGCVRFSYLPPGSQTPRRFRCQPEASAVLRPGPPPEEIQPDPLVHAPAFGSLRYGSPHYAVLSPETPLAIREASDDEAEPGVFHDLFFPHIEANVRARLAEFLPLGLDAGLTLVT